MADRNLVLQLLITAKDQASSVFGKVFSALNDATNVIASTVREAFSNLFGGGLDSAAAFEQQLNAVAAKGGYTAAELEKLRAAADQIGAQFGVSGLEAAKGMEVLAAAGLKVNDVITTLPQVMALARLEGTSLDATATKLADSLSVMGLGFEHAGRMADVLAQGANITLSSASQLGDALTLAGGAAKNYGLDLEQAVAALDLLHKNGIKGSEAGNALKNILLQLLDPTSQASQAIEALGGNARDFESVLEALRPQTEAAKNAILKFGTEAAPALFALRKEGVQGMAEFTSQLRNAAGAAQTASDTMSGGLNKALEALSAAWETLKRNLLTPLLEPLTRQAQALTSRLNDLAQSPAIRQFGEVIAAAAKTGLDWLNRLATEGVGALQRFTGGLSFAAITQKVSDAKENLTRLIGAGLDATAAKFREVATGIVQTSTQLVVDIKTGLIGLLDGIRQLPIVQGEAFDKLTASIRTLKQGLPELAAVAKAAGEQSAAAQQDYNAALKRTEQAYSDLKTGAGEYERSVREGAARMGVSEQEYIDYIKQHGVELEKVIPIEVERFQAVTAAQAELIQQTQKKNEVDQAGFDLAKTLAAAGIDAAEIKRIEALAAGDLTTALQIEAEQRQAATAATQDQADADQARTESAAQATAETQRAAEAEKQHAEQVKQLANAAAVFYSTLSQKAAQAWSYWDGLYFAVQAVSEPVFETGNAFDQLAEKVRSNADNMYINLALASASIERAFFAQKKVLTDYAGQLETAGYWMDRLAEKTQAGTVTMQDVALATRAADQELGYLDEQDLEQLRGAIGDANAQLRQMQEEAQSAQDRLAELNAEIAKERGDTTTADRLRLELEQRQALADLESQLAEARAANNRELIALYEEQKRKLQELYDLKERNLRQEQQTSAAASAASAASAAQPTSSRTGGGGSGVSIVVNAPNARLLDDQFVAILARRLAPEFSNINRRLS